MGGAGALALVSGWLCVSRVRRGQVLGKMHGVPGGHGPSPGCGLRIRGYCWARPCNLTRFCDLTVFRAQAAVTREKHKNSRFCSWSFICCRDGSGGASFPPF